VRRSICLTGAVLAATLLGMTLPALAGDPPGDPASGRRIAEQWCASCHAVEARPERAPVDGVPAFRTVANQPGYQVGYIKAFLTMPHRPMPNLSLSRMDINDLAAYLDQLHDR
jgi:cytochrome c